MYKIYIYCFSNNSLVIQMTTPELDEDSHIEFHISHEITKKEQEFIRNIKLTFLIAVLLAIIVLLIVFLLNL